MGGTANATWSEGSFGTPTLRISYAPPEGDATTATGGSPLELAIPRTAFALGDEAFVALTLAESSTTALTQDVTLLVEFDYLGAEPATSVTSC